MDNIAVTTHEMAQEVRIAPKYFYYVPRTRAELARLLGQGFKGHNLTKRQLYAIYHARRRKEIV